MQNRIFSIRIFRIWDQNRIHVDFGMHARGRRLSYLFVMCRFTLFFALGYVMHVITICQRYRETDGRTE